MEPKLAVFDMKSYVLNAIWPEDMKVQHACTYDHLLDMLCRIESGEIEGEKAHRWLGFIQGVLCTLGVPLDVMKEVNRKANYKLPTSLAIQEGGKHYKTKAIQPVEYWHANHLDAFQGAGVKYLTRFREKGGLLDLKKVIHYTQILIELEYGVRSKMEYEEPK